MKTTFKSKIDIGIVFIIVFVIGLSAIPMFLSPISWIGIIILLFTLIFIIYIFVAIKYVIEDNQLFIQTGISKSLKIDIHSISKISKTNNILSSPAASLDRIEIEYGSRNKIIISPKNRNDFFIKIKEINPQVVIDLE